MDGTYSFVYGSVGGVGIGVFRITNNALVGVDLAGGKYRGTVAENSETGEITISFEMTVAPGMFLVQGVSPQDVEYTRQASVKVPAGFNGGKPFEVYVAPGTLTMMVHRIPDDYASYADGVSVSIRPLSN